MLSCAMLAKKGMAQATFIDKVSVDYVKTVAVWPLLKEIQAEWFERMKDNRPKEAVSYFNFTGDNQKSIYKLTQAYTVPKGKWFEPFADNNIVYNDYITGITVSQKPIYEGNYLVQDSLLRIKWKITADTRNIAGFECRKAVGILYDTVAVFAFYTDEITVNGGPEGINGLPGMILGVGIPRLHTTWFASSVKIASQAALNTVTAPTKGKKGDRQMMLNALSTALKEWGDYGKKMMLAWMI